MTTTAALNNLNNLTTDMIEKLANYLTREVYGETVATGARRRRVNDNYHTNMARIEAHLAERGFTLGTYADGTFCVSPA